MAGKHTGLQSNIRAEMVAYEHATRGLLPEPPLRGRHHKTCAPAIIRAHYHRWNASTERAYARKEAPLGLVQGR